MLNWEVGKQFTNHYKKTNWRGQSEFNSPHKSYTITLHYILVLKCCKKTQHCNYTIQTLKLKTKTVQPSKCQRWLIYSTDALPLL